MAAEWIDVGPADALEDGASLSVEVEGYGIVIARCKEGLFAVEDRCTHDGEPLAGGGVDGCEIICPRHGARFCLRTGDALSPPAYEPVRTFQVREEEGRLYVERPEY